MTRAKWKYAVTLFIGLAVVTLTACPDDELDNGDAGAAQDLRTDTESQGDTADTDESSDTSGDTGANDASEPADGASDTSDGSNEDTSADASSADTMPGDTSDQTDGHADTTPKDTSTHDSAGDSGPSLCGGPQGTKCASDQWCDYGPNTCGKANQTGVCKPRPKGCKKDYAPVCGCNGQTYGNQCMAEAAGIDILHSSACKSSTCRPGSGSCQSGEYCDYPDDKCGNSKSGTCKQTPKTCPTNMNPVCGCDGTTYDNACLAGSASVDIKHEGKCKTTSGCGPNAGSCGPKEYCDFPDDLCGKGKPGTCKKRPGACIQVLDYVCGCDNKTYNSGACSAHQAGIDIKSDTKCKNP